MNEIFELLEAGPDSSTSPEFLQPFTGADDTPAKREKLAVLVSTGKSKEAIGVQLTHADVKRLSDKDVEKYIIMTSFVQEVERLLPDIMRIIERANDAN